MNIQLIMKQAQGMISANSPAILTAVGVTGTVTTAVLAARAAFRVGKDVNAGHYENIMEGREPEYYDLKALATTYWKEFIPPVAVGSATIACIVGSNHISSRRNAALVSAYTLAEKAFSEYKDKVVEKIGAGKEQKVRDEIVQDKVKTNPPGDGILVVGTGDVLCMDNMTGRYFLSNMERMRKAQNDINQTILNSEMCASLNELWEEMGLSGTGIGEELGFNLDNLVDLQFSAVMAEDGRPCIGVGFARFPKAGYNKVF